MNKKLLCLVALTMCFIASYAQRSKDLQKTVISKPAILTTKYPTGSVGELVQTKNVYDKFTEEEKKFIMDNAKISSTDLYAKLSNVNFKYNCRFCPSILCILYPEKCPTPPPSNPVVVNRVEKAGNLDYKIYLQEPSTANNRKGIVLLAHGDGGSINDGTLNAQCQALANEGYIAATTTYRSLDNVSWNDGIANYKVDFENYIQTTTTKYSVARSKVVLGGSSRGSNELFYVLIPGQGDGKSLITGIKGAILECAGGDYYKGSAITVPTAFMGNTIDNGQDNATAADFCNGLKNNSNINNNDIVKNLSECRIILGTGHCSDPKNEYTPFIIKKLKEWLP